MSSLSAVSLDGMPTGSISPDLRDDLHRIFDETYLAANHDFLDRALGRFAHLAVARAGGEGTVGEDTTVGFAIAEMRALDLPRLGTQPVVLAGLCCVQAAYRRQGLFRRLEVHAATAGALPGAERLLSAGRMAHPVSFRVMSRLPTAVPRPDRPPTEWQQEIAAVVAAALGIERFDPETFVCTGDGTPIGTPILDIDVTAEEWKVFAPVDRSRGDALLGMCWFPDAPTGW